MAPLFFSLREFPPRPVVGNGNVSQMYSNPIFIVE